jgi:hypothetical protein
VGPATVHRLRKPIIKPTWTATTKRLDVKPGWPWARALRQELGRLRLAASLPTPKCRPHVLPLPPVREIKCFWHRVPDTPWAILYKVGGEQGEYLVLIALVWANG